MQQLPIQRQTHTPEQTQERVIVPAPVSLCTLSIAMGLVLAGYIAGTVLG